MLDRFLSMRVFSQAALHWAACQQRAGLCICHRQWRPNIWMPLEARLGIKLVHRTTRQLTLTDAGSQYLESCRRILREVDEADSEVLAQRNEAVGQLRMNVPLSFGVRFIAPLLPEFSRRYPQVEVELGLSDAKQDLIRGGWDLAIRIGHLAESSLKAQKIGRL